jgi:hypothetical protein
MPLGGATFDENGVSGSPGSRPPRASEESTDRRPLRGSDETSPFRDFEGRNASRC